MNDSPLDLLKRNFLPTCDEFESQVSEIRDPPSVVFLGDLKTPPSGDDPNELLQHRFLCRGSMCLVSGPTGVGKSSLIMQAAIFWSIGKPFFEIAPGSLYQGQGMRILIVQAENDDGDLAEMRDGVLAGCDDISAEEKEWAKRQIKICTITDKCSDRFATALKNVLTTCQESFDIVIVDPAFAYLGGDGNSQRDVSHFMRELLNPLLKAHNVGLILVHHTNKPLRGKEKDNWSAGDFAYVGSGSAEWINPVRAALALRSVGSETVFELRAPKRGKRLRWLDDNEKPTTRKLIAHDTRPHIICWHSATPDEIANAAKQSGRPKEHYPFELVHAVLVRPGQKQRRYTATASTVLQCGTSTAVRMIKECVTAGWLQENGRGQNKTYEVTEKGLEEAKKRPTKHDWSENDPKPVKA